MSRAVFLDRDGVINKVIFRNGTPSTPLRFEEFEWVNGVGEEVKRIKDAGFHIFVITNQPDVARGILSFEELEKMSATIRSSLPIEGVLVCPHDDDAQCACRKPKSGMIQFVREKFFIDLGGSYVIGDGWRDMELAKNVGCKGILIDAFYNKGVACYRRVKDIHEAANLILSS